MAVANYTDINGHYPPAFILGPDGKPWHSWRVLILPYMEHDALFKEYKFDEPWNGPNNSKLAGRMPTAFAFTGEYFPGSTTTNYTVVVGEETMFPGSRKVKREDILDGLSNTILIVENLGAGFHWMEPRDLNINEMDFNLNSPRGISSKYRQPAVLAANEKVHKLNLKISPQTLRALLTINGKEPIGQNAEGFWEIIPDGRDRPLLKP